MSVVIQELEVVPQEEQHAPAPSQGQGVSPPSGPEKAIGVVEVRRIDRHMHERSLRIWAH